MSQAVEIDAFLESDCPYRSGIWRGFLIASLTNFNSHRDILCEKRAVRADMAAMYVEAPLLVHEMIRNAINANKALALMHCDDGESYRAVLAAMLRRILEI